MGLAASKINGVVWPAWIRARSFVQSLLKASFQMLITLGAKIDEVLVELVVDLLPQRLQIMVLDSRLLRFRF